MKRLAYVALLLCNPHMRHLSEYRSRLPLPVWKELIINHSLFGLYHANVLVSNGQYMCISLNCGLVDCIHSKKHLISVGVVSSRIDPV